MKNSINTVCDFCSSVLSGKSGTATMKKEYLSIRGQVCLVEYHEDTKDEKYTYMSEKNDLTFFHFCAKKSCLLDYIQARRVMRDEYKKSHVMDYSGYGDDNN